jgi:hypothetical protein
MKKYVIAIEKDIDKQYNDAAVYYQESINENELNVDVYLNLAFLYWNFQDYGFFTYYNISEELAEIGYKKYPEILKKGLEVFPNNLELHFWDKYFSHILYGEDFTKENCLTLINEYNENESLVPYFFLFLFDKVKYKKERDELLEIANDTPTAKNLYVKSILEKPI